MLWVNNFHFYTTFKYVCVLPGELRECSSMATSADKFTLRNKPPRLMNRRGVRRNTNHLRRFRPV
jgi:hypothetical protein